MNSAISNSTNSRAIDSLSDDALQEYYALAFYRVYGKLPRSRHLETNRAALISKIKVLNHAKSRLHIDV